MVMQWLVPTILTALSGYLVKELKENKKSNTAIKDSMVLLLRSQITGKIEKYMELGYLPDYARSCIEDLFTQYKSLGGNHGVDLLVNLCFNLPPVNINKGGK